MSKYPKQSNKQGGTLLKMACCDCGLVHSVTFGVSKQGDISLCFNRDNRATAQMRRRKWPYLVSPRKNDKWIMVRIKK